MFCLSTTLPHIRMYYLFTPPNSNSHACHNWWPTVLAHNLAPHGKSWCQRCSSSCSIWIYFTHCGSLQYVDTLLKTKTTFMCAFPRWSSTLSSASQYVALCKLPHTLQQLEAKQCLFQAHWNWFHKCWPYLVCLQFGDFATCIPICYIKQIQRERRRGNPGALCQSKPPIHAILADKKMHSIHLRILCWRATTNCTPIIWLPKLHKLQ